MKDDDHTTKLAPILHIIHNKGESYVPRINNTIVYVACVQRVKQKLNPPPDAASVDLSDVRIEASTGGDRDNKQNVCVNETKKSV